MDPGINANNQKISGPSSGTIETGNTDAVTGGAIADLSDVRVHDNGELWNHGFGGQHFIHRRAWRHGDLATGTNATVSQGKWHGDVWCYFVDSSFTSGHGRGALTTGASTLTDSGLTTSGKLSLELLTPGRQSRPPMLSISNGGTIANF